MRRLSLADAALAAKVPEPRLVLHSRIVAWGLALCFFVCVTTVAGRLLLSTQPALGIPIEVPVAAVCVAAGGFLVLSIWTLPLLVWYRRRFREAAAMSQHRSQDSGR